MDEADTLKRLEARIAYLEQDALQRVPDQTVHQFVLLALIAWFFERNPDADFDRLANELMNSVDDLPIPDAPPAAAERVRARIANSMSEFLALSLLKVKDMKKGL